VIPLEKYVVISKEKESVNLNRTLSDAQIQGTFRGVLEYLINDKTPPGNVSYSDEQNTLRNILATAYADPQSGFIMAFIDANNTPRSVNLDERICDQKNYLHTDVRICDNHEQEYQKLILVCDTSYTGGTTKTYGLEDRV